MADFLTTAGVSHQLEETIKNADERLVLISPYVRIGKRLRELIEDKDRMKIDVRFVYGKDALRPDEREWLDSMDSARTTFCEDLHAKCYLNEKQVLLTSMNLYEFSQINNHEMGMLVIREEEPELYGEIYQEVKRILRISKAVPQKPGGGFCIRCRKDIPANPAKPYCPGCYKGREKDGNRHLKEDHCHLCGAKHRATLSKPACKPCYAKHAGLFSFPSPKTKRRFAYRKTK